MIQDSGFCGEKAGEKITEYFVKTVEKGSFARLQKDHPGIEYEMLLGDYEEVERWIREGRVDCGFLWLPTVAKFDTVLLKQDEYKVVLPMEHSLDNA